MSMREALKTGVQAHSPAAMEALGRAVARSFASGGTVALRGDLGAGKTTFVRGMAQAVGVQNITSPSFNYYFIYKNAAQPLLHLDAYRLNSPADYPSLMIDELLTAQTLFVVEWPERLGEFLPNNAATLELKILHPGTHEVKLIN